MNHLNEQQISELLAATPRDLRESPADSELAAMQTHAAECAECGAALNRFRESMSLFSEATTAHAEERMRRVPAWQPRARRTLVFHPAYWAAAAAGLLLAAFVPMQMANRHPVQQPIPVQAADTPQSGTTLESDEALLESVSQELSESVPTPMAALADPTGSANQASQNFTQRTN